MLLVSSSLVNAYTDSVRNIRLYQSLLWTVINWYIIWKLILLANLAIFCQRIYYSLYLDICTKKLKGNYKIIKIFMTPWKNKQILCYLLSIRLYYAALWIIIVSKLNWVQGSDDKNVKNVSWKEIIFFNQKFPPALKKEAIHPAPKNNTFIYFLWPFLATFFPDPYPH